MKPAGRVLSTLEEDGSRRWRFPRVAIGRFFHARRAVAYLLIAVYALLPFIKIGGKPAILLDFVHRRFTLFGYTFLPTDTILLALLAVTTILLVFLTTALLGRIWCGWACPQTVYLEFLFRPIERLLTGRAGVGGKPKGEVAGWRYAILYALYFVFSLHLANTFLAYFVGAATLHEWIFASPLLHPAGFITVAVVTLAMLFNFGFFREQTCLIACPYGRLQSVLLDRSSLIISYDTRRGEPRGKKERVKDDAAKLKQGQVADLSSHILPASASKGDCIDCGLCVAVCPTGIDIRDGLQFECVGCAQCIDVCDDVMTKVSRPKGLIRYGSQAGMAGEKARLIRPRVLIYPAIILVLGSLLGYLLLTKSLADVMIFRGPGLPFIISPTGEVANVLRVKLTNRSDEARRMTITIAGEGLRTITSQPVITLGPEQTWEEPVEVFAPEKAFAGTGSMNVTIRVASADDKGAIRIDRPFKLMGPMSPTVMQPSSSAPSSVPASTATQPSTSSGVRP